MPTAQQKRAAQIELGDAVSQAITKGLKDAEKHPKPYDQALCVRVAIKGRGLKVVWDHSRRGRTARRIAEHQAMLDSV